MNELVSSDRYKGYLNNIVINMKEHCWDMYKSNVMGDKQVIKTMEDGDPEAQIAQMIRWAQGLFPVWAATVQSMLPGTKCGFK